MEASEVIFVTVGSFVGSLSKSGPSKSSLPSSEISVTSSVFPGLDPVAVTVSPMMVMKILMDLI
jgi:hypothetical protein